MASLAWHHILTLVESPTADDRHGDHVDGVAEATVKEAADYGSG